MKIGILALLLLMGVQLQASASAIFSDRDLGILMEIPQQLEKNWEITHTPTGTKLNVYSSGEVDEVFYALVLGKVSPKTFGFEKMESLYPFILSQIQEVIGEGAIFDDDDFVFEIAQLRLNADLDVDFKSYRLRITVGDDDDDEMTMPIDVHVFESNGYALFLLTASSPWGDEQQLTGFSEALLESVQFIGQAG